MPSLTAIQFLTEPALWTGAGGGIIGALSTRMKLRRTRMNLLEAEVEASRRRDAKLIVLEAGFRLVVTELMAINPASPALAMCASLLNREMGPVNHDLSSFKDLLDELDRAELAEKVKKARVEEKKE